MIKLRSLLVYFMGLSPIQTKSRKQIANYQLQIQNYIYKAKTHLQK